MLLKKIFIFSLIFVCLSEGLHAYQLMGVKWRLASFPIPYYVNNTLSPVTPSTALNTINASFQAWSSVQTTRVDFAYMGPTTRQPLDFYDYSTFDGYNVIGWYNMFWYLPGVLGLTISWPDDTGNYINETDIALDTMVSWSTSNSPGYWDVDLQYVLMHEIGHFLGFDHVNNDPDNLMYPYYNSGSIMRSLPAEYASALTVEYPGMKSAEIGAPPVELMKSYPNPFKPRTTGDYAVIGFVLDRDDHVRIDIFNMAGELVKTLIDVNLLAGSYTGSNGIKWYGDNGGPDSLGQKVASGVYIYQLRTGSGHTKIEKLMLIR